MKTPSETPAGAPATQTLEAGDELCDGRFEVQGFLAQGGMGEVYEAEDRTLRERVALKTVRLDLVETPIVVARFTQETRLARQVTHPNICRVHDMFRWERPDPGAPERQQIILFLTMELLTGETLAKRIKRAGRLTPEQALPVIEQLADGLSAAHKVGIVHRDFKTSNVMLVEPKVSDSHHGPARSGVLAERAVITDFGLAFDMLSPERLTAFGVRPGTPSYMAPEQLVSGAITAATDVYALGVVMFEMVTGTRLFRTESVESAVRQRFAGAPRSPREEVPELDLHWEAVILRCLQVNATKRFASMEALVAELKRAPSAPELAGASEPSAPAVERLIRASERHSPVVEAAPAAVVPPTVRRSAIGEEATEVDGSPPAASAASRVVTPARGLSRKVVIGLVVAGVATLAVVALLVSGAATSGDAKTAPRSAKVAQPVLPAPPQPIVLPPPTNPAPAPVLDPHAQAEELLLQARAKMRLWDSFSARNLLVKAAALDPQNLQVQLVLADAYWHLGFVLRQKVSAQNALELSKGRSRGEELAAQFRYYSATQNYALGVKAVRTLLTLFPNDVDLAIAAVGEEIRARAQDRAAALLKKLRDLGPPVADDPRIEIAECNLRLNMNMIPQALVAGTRAITAADRNGSNFLRGEALLCQGAAYARSGQYRDATEVVSRAYPLFRPWGVSGPSARATTMLCASAKELRDWPRARAMFNESASQWRRLGNRSRLATLLETGVLIAQMENNAALAESYRTEAARLRADAAAEEKRAR